MDRYLAVVSQFLTLYTTPIIYLYLDRLNSWLGRGNAPAPGRTPIDSPRAT